MKTTLDLVDDIFELLDITPVHNVMLSGDVFLNERPDNHKNECIVINSLPVTGEQLQRGVVNVNITVPNLKLTINGQPDNSQPNRARLKAISAVVIPILEDAFVNDTVTGIQTITLVNDKEIKEHFLNIRVETNSINLK